ncbi:hypothetical protein ACFXTO_028024 [Malus domestica]
MKDHRINGVRRRMSFKKGFNVPHHDIEQLTSQLGELQMNWGDHVEEINVKSRLLDQLLAQEESVETEVTHQMA